MEVCFNLRLNMTMAIFFSRAVKSSFKELMTLPAFEVLSKNWKDDILTEFNFIWKGEDRELCGIAMDPVKFIKQYMVRFLGRREMEGHLPEPGNYQIQLKASLFIAFSSAIPPIDPI